LPPAGCTAAKLHNLHVVDRTPLAESYRSGVYRALELDEYVDLTVRFLERLPPSVLIRRVSGEAPRRLTVAPAWSVNKLAVINAIQRELARRDSWQGRALGYTRQELLAPVCLPGERQ
jgi:radical SAM superfamily enzyme